MEFFLQNTHCDCFMVREPLYPFTSKYPPQERHWAPYGPEWTGQHGASWPQDPWTHSPPLLWTNSKCFLKSMVPGFHQNGGKEMENRRNSIGVLISGPAYKNAYFLYQYCVEEREGRKLLPKQFKKISCNWKIRVNRLKEPTAYLAQWVEIDPCKFQNSRQGQFYKLRVRR